MYIKDQILYSVILSLVLIVGISGSVIVTYQDVRNLQHQEDLAAEVVRGAYELTYLTNDYLINAQPRTRIQWDDRYASLQSIITQLEAKNPEEQRSIEAIREYSDTIGLLFREMPGTGTTSTGAALFSPAIQQVMWNRNSVQLQGLISEAWRLRHEYDDDVSDAQVRNNILVLALIVSILVIISINYLVISRRLIRSVRVINEGIAKFGAGELGHRIPVSSDDEIGGMARGLNAMADQLRNVTASRDDMEREITERKAAEQALRESEEKFSTAFRSSPYAITITRAEDGRFLEVNEAFTAITGYSRDETIGGSSIGLALWVLVADRDRVISTLREGRSVDGQEFCFRKKNGDIMTGLFSARMLLLNGETCILSSINDITGRKQIEESLRESEEKFRLVVENAPDAIFIQVAGRFAYLNPAGYRLFGADTPDQLLARLVPDHIHPDFRDNVRERMRMLNEDRLPVSRIPETILTLEGRAVEVEISAVPVVFSGQNGALVFMVDTSDRRAAEYQRETLIRELEQKNAELERFTYTVSHDLKSPLITIKGFLGLLREDAVSADTVQLEHDIRRISAATDKMQVLLEDLLTLSRIGRVINPPERVSFGIIAEEAREVLAGVIAEHHVSVTIAPGLPDVLVDHARIREALTNLLENAVKFRGNQIKPSVEIGVMDREGETLFFVTDNGIGIESLDLSRIFGLFEKLEPRSEGTGIGLAIVRRIIEVHGGRIWAESAGRGQGTTFFFTLPLAGDAEIRGGTVR